MLCRHRTRSIWTTAQVVCDTLAGERTLPWNCPWTPTRVPIPVSVDVDQLSRKEVELVRPDINGINFLNTNHTDVGQALSILGQLLGGRVLYNHTATVGGNARLFAIVGVGVRLHLDRIDKK